MNLNKENIEEHILLFVDAELDEDAAQQLMEYIEEHPEYQAMLDAYMMTQLDQAELIAYPDKEALLQKETQIVPLPLRPQWKRWAAAAALLIIAGSAFFFLNKKEEINDQNQVARQKQIVDPIMPGKTDPAAAKDSSMAPVIAKQVSKSIPNPVTAKRQNNTPVAGNQQEHIAVVSKEEEVTPLVLQQQPSLQETRIDIVATEQINTLEQPEIAATDKLPGWLPVNEENLQGVNDLIAHIQTLKEKVQQKTSKLKGAAFVIRFGDKEIGLGNNKKQ